ncbi:MAG: sulfur carrier protein ThiS [Lachnospiraceae bacterium]|nr:sulfur carrier protein ThiS [Lachnospiraceae bacterium]
MKINGILTEETFHSMEELLEKKGYQIKYVAVECNGQILPKNQFCTYVPKQEDVIEIVSFVGGG